MTDKRMDSGEKQLGDFPLIQRLIGSIDDSNISDLNQDLCMQSVFNLFVYAGKIAEAAGHSNRTDYTFDVANPKLILVEIENMLTDLIVLVSQAQLLAWQQTLWHAQQNQD